MTHPLLALLRALCFEGGGARCRAFIAVLEALDPHLPPHLRGWRVPVAAGTSAGAIAALAIALRLPLRWALDGIPWGRIGPRFGLWGNTKRLRRCLEQMVREGGLPAEVTLAELPERTGCTLYVTVRDLTWSSTRTLLLGPEMLGDLPVVDAVTASAALPGVFRPVRLGRLTLWDGGVAANYPFDLVLERHDLVPEQMLGLRVDLPDEVGEGHYIEPPSWWEALPRLVLGLAAEANSHVPEELWEDRTVRVLVDDSVRASDFDLTTAQQQMLDQRGREAAVAWLERDREEAA